MYKTKENNKNKNIDLFANQTLLDVEVVVVLVDEMLVLVEVLLAVVLG